MPENDDYKYDVFISYSSADRAWALELAKEFKVKGIKTFFDQDRLEAGQKWADELKVAVRNSRHLIALWSKNANQSAWVQKELANFESAMSDRGASQGEQRLIMLRLEDQNTAYEYFQMVDDLKDAKIYPADFSKLPGGVWAEAVGKLVSAVRNANQTIPIHIALLTATADEMDALTAEDWQNLKDDFGIEQGGLLKQYGPQRTDWKPFGGKGGMAENETIRTILGRLVEYINQALGAPKYHEELVGEDFWTSEKAAEEYRQRLVSNVSLIVIDPIALQVDRVFRRLVRLKSCFESDKSVILVLPPFEPAAAVRKLRERMRSKGEGLFDVFLEPPLILERPLANCGICLHDEEDIKRLLRTSIGRQLQKGQAPPKPPFLGFGGGLGANNPGGRL